MVLESLIHPLLIVLSVLGFQDSDAMHMEHQLSPENVVLFFPGVVALAVLDNGHPVLDIDEVCCVDRILLNHHILIDGDVNRGFADFLQWNPVLPAISLGFLSGWVSHDARLPVVDSLVADMLPFHMGWDDLVFDLSPEVYNFALILHLLELTPSVILLVGVVLLDGLAVYSVAVAVEQRIVLSAELVGVPWHDKYFFCKKLVHILVELMFGLVGVQGVEPCTATADKTENQLTNNE